MSLCRKCERGISGHILSSRPLQAARNQSPEMIVEKNCNVKQQPPASSGRGGHLLAPVTTRVRLLTRHLPTWFDFLFIKYD